MVLPQSGVDIAIEAQCPGSVESVFFFVFVALQQASLCWSQSHFHSLAFFFKSLSFSFNIQSALHERRER